MKSFTGAALYSAKEIFSALDSYQKEVIWADGLLKSKIKEAEESFKPNFWDKIFGRKCLKDKYRNRFCSHAETLYCRGIINFSKEETERFQDLNAYRHFYHFGTWRFVDEYMQVLALVGKGKDCYLNPSQAEFVNKYKE